jgi:hypothetical protein
MTKWITQQEKLHTFATFLHWRASKTHQLEEEETEEETMAASTGPATTHDNVDSEDVDIGRTYHLAKHPAFPNTPLSILATEFHVPDFLPAVVAFMKRTPSRGQAVLTEHTRFDVYKRVTFSLQSIQRIEARDTKDVVRATPYVPRRGQAPAIPAHFDTVLVHFTPDAQETGVKGQLVPVV